MAAAFAVLTVGCSCSGGVSVGDGTPGAKCKTKKDCNNDQVCTDDGICAASCGGSGCENGFYCAADNSCKRDCGPDAGSCPGNAVCMANGQCVTPFDGGGDVDCPDIIVDVAPVVPTVVLLIDQSGSMTENFGGVTRWNAVRTALTDDTNGVVMQLESQVIFGASLYTGTGGQCPRLTSVAPAINNGDEIKELLDDNNPLDNTPTAEAVAAAAAAFPASDGPRILLLATDGDPDTCEDPNSNGQAGPRTGSENAVAAAYASGITTFVLSVGQDTEATHLLNLSRVGQGQDKLTGTATPYIANSPAALAQAFNDIIGDVRTCDFKLDGSVSSGDADQGVVSLDGTPLTYGTDWEINNGDEFKLLGEACNTYLTTDDADLSATFPCGLVVQ